MRLLVATRNSHKLRELGRLLPGIELDPLPDGLPTPPEDGDTYAANALIKARAAMVATGRAAIADDSGIEAEALGGAPGVRTARFAGEHATDAENLAKLAAEAPAGTGLRYVCVIAHVGPDGAEHTFEADTAGTLAAEPRGEGGFGYDPLFVPGEADGRTMAELSDDEKDAISHRGRAARALQAWLMIDSAAVRGSQAGPGGSRPGGQCLGTRDAAVRCVSTDPANRPRSAEITATPAESDLGSPVFRAVLPWSLYDPVGAAPMEISTTRPTRRHAARRRPAPPPSSAAGHAQPSIKPLPKVDRRRQRDREHDPRIAVVVGQQQDPARDHADRDRDQPGDTGQGHRAAILAHGP